MDFTNPPRTFVLVDGVIAPRLFRSLYGRYAASIELHGDEAVLEFGCGSGGISEYLAPRLQHGSLTCVDVCPPMLSIARRRLEKYANVRCLTGRVEELSLDKASIDMVVIHNALHDVQEENRFRTLETLVGILKAGGRMCVREPTKPSHGMPVAAYRELMTKAGLSEVHSKETRVFPIGPVFEAVFVKTPSASLQQTT